MRKNELNSNNQNELKNFKSQNINFQQQIPMDQTDLSNKKGGNLINSNVINNERLAEDNNNNILNKKKNKSYHRQKSRSVTHLPIIMEKFSKEEFTFENENETPKNKNEFQKRT